MEALVQPAGDAGDDGGEHKGLHEQADGAVPRALLDVLSAAHAEAGVALLVFDTGDLHSCAGLVVEN